MKKQVLLLVSLSFFWLSGYADDTEVYAFQYHQKPNVVFIMDTSLSMERLACPSEDEDPSFLNVIGNGLVCAFSGKVIKESRLEALKRAAKTIIEKTRGVHLALMRYNPQLNDAVGGYRAFSDAKQKMGFEVGRKSCLVAETWTVPSPEWGVAMTLQDHCHSGGHFVSGLMDMDDPIQKHALLELLETKINTSNMGLQPWYNSQAARYTPMVETVHEALRYFYGEPVSYGRYYATSTAWRLGRFKDWDGWYWNEPQQKLLSHSDTVVAGERALSLMDQPRYQSPNIDNFPCQKNHIILFTDGVSTFDGESDAAIRSMLAEVPDATLASRYGRLCKTPNDGVERNTEESCLPGLAYAMNQHLPATENKPPVQLHTVAGFLSFFQKGQNMLQRAAELGGGIYAQADSVEEVEQTLSHIFSSIEKHASSLAAPSIAIHDLSSLTFSDEIYYAQFLPSARVGWNGNIKRYRLGQKGILDANGTPAIDEQGYLKPSAKSFWSTHTDGDQVSVGGMASKLTAKRNIFTNGDPVAVGGDEFQSWLYGGVRQQGAMIARKSMEDFLHSTPVLLNYEHDGRVLFVGSNSGYLHAIKTDLNDPKELSAYLPKELLPVAYEYFLGKSVDKHYGLDGPISIWHDDKNNDHIVNHGEKVYLYVGMRRGGNTYYAFDVSDPRAIKLAWQFNVPGQSWSKVHVVDIKWKNQIIHGSNTPINTKKVLVVAGGYDARVEDHYQNVPNQSLGNIVYILDPEKNGAELWNSASFSRDIRDSQKMNRSIVGDVVAIDNQGKGYIDLLYVADIAGRIWRFDLDYGKKTLQSTTDELLVTGAMVADLSHGTERFYNGLNVAYTEQYDYEISSPHQTQIKTQGKGRYTLSLGSGNRAFPNSDRSQGSFYIVFDQMLNSVRDKALYSEVIKRSELLEASSMDDQLSKISYPLFDVSSDRKGYLIRLQGVSEKVLSKSLMVNHTLFFSTYHSLEASLGKGMCVPYLTENRLYSVNLLTGQLAHEVLDIPGIASDPIYVVLPDGHQPKLIISNKVIDLNALNFFPEMHLLYWKEMNDY